MSTKAQRDQLREEAAAWVVRLSDEPCADERALFEAWRGTSPAHELAYERALSSWNRLDRLSSLRAPQIVPDPDILLSPNFSPDQQQVAPVRRRTAPKWQAMAACLLLTLALGYVLVGSLLGAPAYATGIGERRLIVLDDGTKVELNTDTRIVVHYAKGRREVELVRGEAMLRITAGQQPFVLRTKAGRLRTNRSAEVDVRMLGSAAKVTVRQGAIESLGSRSSIPRLLGPSSEAIVSGDEIQVLPIATEAVDRQLAWREGAIALDGQTIYEAVSEINRYNTRQIVVKDQVTGAIRVGGYFQTLDIDEFAAALAKAFALEVVRQADGNLALVAARPAPARAGPQA